MATRKTVVRHTKNQKMPEFAKTFFAEQNKRAAKKKAVKKKKK